MTNISLHPAHGLRIEHIGDRYTRQRGRCSCGWRGPWRESAKEASVDLGRHLADSQIDEMEASSAIVDFVRSMTK